MESLLNIKQVSKILNYGERTIRKWVDSGDLPASHLGQLRFDPADVRGFIEANKVKPKKKSRGNAPTDHLKNYLESN